MTTAELRAQDNAPWHVICRAHTRPVHQAFGYRSGANKWAQEHARTHEVKHLHLWDLHRSDRCPKSKGARR